MPRCEQLEAYHINPPVFDDPEWVKLLWSLNTKKHFTRRYASLYFCCAVEQGDNELLTLEVIHRFVELLDKYFGSVSLHLRLITLLFFAE